jgi:hypothetical protein
MKMKRKRMKMVTRMIRGMMIRIMTRMRRTRRKPCLISRGDPC